ncbi:hypothetical protein BVRB_7g178360 [Beta vulgaris subsp. vulgaris]|nr:hypothetical protein BVRB_7g178360 [Beta vulgaris subsp. vulgaris]
MPQSYLTLSPPLLLSSPHILSSSNPLIRSPFADRPCDKKSTVLVGFVLMVPVDLLFLSIIFSISSR